MLSGGIPIDTGSGPRCVVGEANNIIDAFARSAEEANKSSESDFLAEVNIHFHFKEASRQMQKLREGKRYNAEALAVCEGILKSEAAHAVRYRDGIPQSFFSSATYGVYTPPGQASWGNTYFAGCLSGMSFGLMPLIFGTKGYIDRLTH